MSIPGVDCGLLGYSLVRLKSPLTFWKRQSAHQPANQQRVYVQPRKRKGYSAARVSHLFWVLLWPTLMILWHLWEHSKRLALEPFFCAQMCQLIGSNDWEQPWSCSSWAWPTISARNALGLEWAHKDSCLGLPSFQFLKHRSSCRYFGRGWGSDAGSVFLQVTRSPKPAILQPDILSNGTRQMR